MTAVLPEQNERPPAPAYVDRPGRRVAAVAAIFVALGTVAVAASQGGASAAQSEVEHKQVVQRVAKEHRTVDNIIGPSERDRANLFGRALVTGLGLVAPASRELAFVEAARDVCSALPTWAAEKDRVAQSLSGLVGQTLSEQQVVSFADAAALAYCPAQLGVASR